MKPPTIRYPRPAKALLVAAVALLLLSACGDDDTDDGDASQPDATATSEATDPEAATGAQANDNEEAEAADVTEDAASDAAASEADDAATGAEADDAATDEGAAAPPPAPPLRLLVTNDDGYDSEGIDLVVSALAALDDVEITVVAPLENQSGSSDTRSDTPPTATDETTASGYPVIAVAGTPADAVIYALENVFDDGHPDLIVSGANDGQNVGPLASISGTVGAARTGAREGIPGFAVSVAGITVEPDLDAAIPFVVDWVVENREQVLAADATPAEVWSLNVASCQGNGEVRGLVEVPLAVEFAEGEPFEIDCLSTLEEPDDDATALSHGFAALTLLPEGLVLGIE